VKASTRASITGQNQSNLWGLRFLIAYWALDAAPAGLHGEQETFLAMAARSKLTPVQVLRRLSRRLENERTRCGA
jgi:hypothetical protein